MRRCELKKIFFVLFTFSLIFSASPGDIVVNEIMYNGPETGTDNEWIELFNTTGSAITLDSIWTLSDGEGTFRFPMRALPAGGYLTIKVSQSDSIPFPFTPDIDATGFSIVLGNSSDQVIVRQAAIVIDSVDYYDTWPGWSGHDGGGRSLERISATGPSNSSGNWGASIPNGGTPGARNSIAGTVSDYPPVVGTPTHYPANPIATDSVAINVFLSDDGHIRIARCFYRKISSPYDSLDMFDDGLHRDGVASDNIWGAVIPPNPAGSIIQYYIVVADDSLHWDTTAIRSFTVTTGDTSESDLVINEIMYNPAGDDNVGEYVEFYNRGISIINAGGWVVKDNGESGSFTIPIGSGLVPPGGFLVIAKNPDTIMARYSISDVLGPVGFSLNNTGGDAVRLFNSVGTLMDIVQFNSASPWPTQPNGSGPSLELIHPFSDNNLATSWGASITNGTPGRRNSITSVSEISLPLNFATMSISPNPFNPTTTVKVFLSREGVVELSIFDLRGRCVEKISEGFFCSGNHEFTADLRALSSGIYLFRLRFGGEDVFAKAILIK